MVKFLSSGSVFKRLKGLLVCINLDCLICEWQIEVFYENVCATCTELSTFVVSWAWVLINHAG